MKKLIPFILLTAAALFLGTSTSGTSKGLNIDGYIGAQSGAVAGTNGTSWETDEQLSSGTSGLNWYLSWDNYALYIGREGGNNAEPSLVYLRAEYTGATYTSTPTTYDNFTPDFSNQQINFAAYFKDSYKEYRLYESGWGSATTFWTYNPAYQTYLGTANMESRLAWNDITHNNGAPANFSAVFYQTNGNSGAIFAYGDSPSGNPDGSVSTPTITNWWGGYTVTNGVAPNTISLPVELISLTATSRQSAVSLQWSTATEKNNYGFEVERRTASRADDPFTRVSFVRGAGTVNNTRNYLFVDENVQPGTYEYRLKQIDNNGNFIYTHTVEVVSSVTANEFALHANYPNPFNPSTTIRFSVPQNGNAELKIFNTAGQEVRTLFHETAEPGTLYQVRFDASALTAGIYFARLEFGGKQLVQKLVYAK
jgi:hypothetical protein